MIKTKYWVAGILILLLASAAALTVPRLSTSGTIANIYVAGQCVRSIDLDQVAEPESFTISCADGFNTIYVEPGRIRMTDADCPDQICVNAGWLPDHAAPIVCLPHQMVIQVEKTAAASNSSDLFDAVSQ